MTLDSALFFSQLGSNQQVDQIISEVPASPKTPDPFLHLTNIHEPLRTELRPPKVVEIVGAEATVWWQMKGLSFSLADLVDLTSLQRMENSRGSGGNGG